MQGKDLYREDGVNIALGDDFSTFCSKVCRATYANSPFVEVIDLAKGNFRGPRGFRLKNLPANCLQTLAADGVGTKVVPIVASGKLMTAASNVIAMTAMDITRYGGMPLVFANIFDVASLGEPGSETHRMCLDAMAGLSEITAKHNYVVLNGETAELGACVGSEDPNAKLKFNWGGVMYGVYHPYKMIYGDTLAPGQIIIALRDDFRSNGISSVRKALALRYGKKWFSNPKALPDIIAASTASAQYDRLLNFLHGWLREDTSNLTPIVKMHLIVHLSGGAFESKLGKDMLAPQGLSADLNDLFDPPLIMRQCADWRGLSDEECYKTWNGGQGALVVVDDAKDVSIFMDAARKYDVEAKVVGRIHSPRDYVVRVRSKFTGKTIEY
jgi:phosphoribosylaminoimidazole (AIR) synthetase